MTRGMRFLVTVAVTAILSAACVEPAAQPDSGSVLRSTDYDDLQALFADWREFMEPVRVDGIPDYTAAAMATQLDGLADYRARLNAIDPSGWPIEQQVDYRVVWAEMNGLEFDHRVRQPWARDPSFYVTVFPGRSDVPAREGPHASGASELWTYEYPLTPGAAAQMNGELAIIPPLLEQARLNLVGNARDLWVVGARVVEAQVDDLESLGGRVAGTNADLGATIAQARDATADFVGWLDGQAPSKTGPSGVGRDNYTWALKNIHLVPYTWDQVHTIMQRELWRAYAGMTLEEHHNRDLPELQAPTTAEEYDRRGRQAIEEYLQFLEEEEILPLTDYMAEAIRARLGRFNPSTGPRSFFSEVTYRDPIVMKTHDTHWMELARIERESHPNPIRRGGLPFNIYDTRSEGLATAMEEMMMHAGVLDTRPRARELIYVLLGQRAARAISGLKMHSNDFTIDDAMAHAVEWTPRGWLQNNGELVRFEQHLYLTQPVYGNSYIIGKVEIDKLMMERRRQLGDDFTMLDFLDDIFTNGVIPFSLLRWQLTGKSDEIDAIVAGYRPL